MILITVALKSLKLSIMTYKSNNKKFNIYMPISQKRDYLYVDEIVTGWFYDICLENQRIGKSVLIQKTMLYHPFLTNYD